MYAVFSRFSLPLLSKELTEQSARGRTFLLRTVYAVALYGVGLGSFVHQSGGWDNLSFSILGTGGRLFTAVVQYQLAAIYLLLPIMTAGTVTSEKERDTLGILLITKLDPWTIVLEKFLSRVVPMLLYILMALPLLAVAYSLGGVENGQVLQAGVVLTLCILQVGSLATFCSVWFRTTAQAVVAAYLSLGVIWVSGRILLQVALERSWAWDGPGNVWLTPAYEYSAVLLPMFMVPAYLQEMPSFVLSNLASVIGLALVPVLALLTAARLALWPRAFLSAKSWGLILLKALDQFFHVINQNAITRGVVIFRDHVPLPTSRPLAWRELNKRSLGTTRYLIRVLLLTEAPLIAALLLPLATGDVFESRSYYAGEWALTAVWLLAVFMLLVQSTALITGERARQTLDVLMSTPMMTREIVMQKMAGVNYLTRILYIPMATAAVFWLFWLEAGMQRISGDQSLWQVLRLVVQPVIYLPLIAWGGFYCGLRCKSQTQAMLLGCVILAVLIGLPRVLLPLLVIAGVNQVITLPGGFQFVNQDPSIYGGPEASLLAYPLQLLFPCSNYFETLLARDNGYYSGRPEVPGVVRLIEILHWGLYASTAWMLRTRAPQALTRSTQRAEAPLEDLALEPA